MGTAKTSDGLGHLPVGEDVTELQAEFVGQLSLPTGLGTRQHQHGVGRVQTGQGAGDQNKEGNMI